MQPTDPHINPATGVWDDNYYANIGKYGGSSGGGNNVDSYLQSVIDSVTEPLKQYNSRFTEFAKKNPFNFDDMLKKQTDQVKQRLDPYYTQQLGNFLQGTEIKKARSLEDERNLLGYLTQTADKYNDQEKAILGSNLNNLDQETVLGGLGDSGIAKRQQGEQVANTENKLNNYNTQNQYEMNKTKTEGQRYRGYDIPTSQNLEKQQVGEEQTYQTKAQALSQTQQAQNQYQFAQQQYAGGTPGSDLNYQNNLYKLIGQ